MNTMPKPPSPPHTASVNAAARATAAETKALEYLDGWKRARADYENLQKRLQEEVAAAREDGKQGVLRQLLPTFDQFETAVATVPEPWRGSPWIEGLQRIQQGWRKTLDAAGVTVIEEAGVPFDPTRHEAIGEEASDYPVGTVAMVLARGYACHAVVLRPAKVKVSSGPTAPLGTRGKP